MVVSDRMQRWGLLVACASGLVVAIDNLILNVALPTLAKELHASSAELQLIVDAYLLAFAGMLLVAGNLGDRFGRVRVLRLGLIVFGTSSGIAAWSASPAALIACRAVMGVGGAMILPNGLSTVSTLFASPVERARAFGVWAAVNGMGFALGPVLGGLLLARFWWGSVFLVNVPVAIGVLTAGYFVLPESRDRTTSRFDPLGVVLSVIGVTMLVWATVRAPETGWTSSSTLLTFALALVVLAMFVAWELRVEHPMLELAFFRNARFTAANVGTFAGGFTYSGALFVLTQLLQFVMGASPPKAGIQLIPYAASFMLAGFLSPRVAERIGTKLTVAVGLGILALGMVALGLTAGDVDYRSVVVAIVAIGIGFGLINAPLTESVMGAVPREKAGLGSGTNVTTRQVANAFGVAAFGSLLTSGYQSRLTDHAARLSLPGRTLAAARESVSRGLDAAHGLGGVPGRRLAQAARDAFLHGLHLSTLAGLAVLVSGAALTLRFLPARGDTVSGADETI